MSALGRPMTWIGLRDLHVPENRRSELENVPDVLPESRRLEPFSPWHVCHFAESDLLDLIWRAVGVSSHRSRAPNR